MRNGFLFALFALLGAVGIARPDPLPVSHDVKVFSPNHRFYVLSLLKQKQTLIFRTDQPGKPYWALPFYTPLPNLANDGTHLATSYEHGNILDDDIRPTDPLITLYNSGGKKIVLSVQDVIGDFHRLDHATDGWVWGSVRDFDTSGNLLVDLRDGQTLSIDPDHPQPKPAGRWHNEP